MQISTLKNSPEKYVVVSKLSNKFQMGKKNSLYSYLEKGCRKKKHQSERDKTERWSGYSQEFCILAWRKCTIQVCIFACEELVFSSQEAFICSFTFTVASL